MNPVRLSPLLLALLLTPGGALAGKPKPASKPVEPYTPAPASEIPAYSEKALPCDISADPGGYHVTCKGFDLTKKPLRELSIQRNTIFARYGFNGFRKRWLREYFQKQPWYKPNPRFSYRLLSNDDQLNVYYISIAELSPDTWELERRVDTIYARLGKTWDDVPQWKLQDGSIVRSCESQPSATKLPHPEGRTEARDCYFQKQGFQPDPHWQDKLGTLSEEDRIELGLLKRGLGEFELDEGKAQQLSLDGVLSVTDLRQLSLRDLRILRNTIFARRGRPFKSPILQQHFAKMSWYKEDPSYTDDRLTENDKRNMALIRSVEDELGGALKDQDWKAPDLKIPGIKIPSPDEYQPA